MKHERAAYVSTTVMRSVLLVLVVLALSRVGSAEAQERAHLLPPPWTAAPTASPAVAPPLSDDEAWSSDAQMRSALATATPHARHVLETVQAMLAEDVIVRGSCFDWAEAVYTRAAGHPHDAFHSSREHGPYADASVFHPGDWVFFINGATVDETHSAIFVGWVDQAQRTAMMVSYAGGRREEPGRFGTYTLTTAYRIVRELEDGEEPVTIGGGHAARLASPGTHAHRSRTPAHTRPSSTGPAPRHRARRRARTRAGA